MRLTGKSDPKKVKALIHELAEQNPKVPANMLHAISNVRKSQLMDTNLWNFKNLEEQLVDISAEDDSEEMAHEPFDNEMPMTETEEKSVVVKFVR